MGEQANILAQKLLDLDKKLDAIAEQQKALDAKVERYSAFLVKKLNDSVDSLCNMQSAQLKLLTDSLVKMGSQADVMEREIARFCAPDERNAEIMQALDGLAEDLGEAEARYTELLAHHAEMIEQNLMEGMHSLTGLMEADMKLEQDHSDALSQKISQSFTHLYDGILTSQELIQNPEPVIECPEAIPECTEAVPENPEAIPENPEGVLINPDIAVFENPDAVIINGNETEDHIK